jgi:hypothetical protein
MSPAVAPLFEQVRAIPPGTLIPPTTHARVAAPVDRGPGLAIPAQRAYVRAFFDLHLRHRDDRLLRRPAPRYPQVRFVR